jgi:hypothetical protein
MATSVIALRNIPDDVSDLIIEEKARIEKKTRRSATNPEAIFNLIRRSKNVPKSNSAI